MDFPRVRHHELEFWTKMKECPFNNEQGKQKGLFKVGVSISVSEPQGWSLLNIFTIEMTEHSESRARDPVQRGVGARFIIPLLKRN